MSLFTVRLYRKCYCRIICTLINTILITDKNTQEINEKVSSFITACWDIGMKIGHSVRTLKDTRFEIHKDVKTTTNLLETRLIKGSKNDFIALLKCIKNEKTY